MQVKEQTKSNHLNRELLDRIIEREKPDEMGLLDLAFVEMILPRRLRHTRVDK